MNHEYLDLSYAQVAIAAALILVNGVISIAMGLGLERRLFVAAVRTVVQLLLVGLVLGWVFAAGQWYVVLAIGCGMTLVAGLAAVGRSERGYRGIRVDSILSMWASSWTITAIALLAVVRVEPWFGPQYAIPLLGMILGNTLNGISLGMDRLTDELDQRRDRVDALLAMGASRREAAREAIQNAVRTGMVPTINSMMVVGIVSLPGMMTGQLLGGVPPAEAVKYQIVIMFLIASGTALGTVSAVLLGYRRLFNTRHQFLHDHICRR